MNAVACRRLNVPMGLDVGHWREICARKGFIFLLLVQMTAQETTGFFADFRFTDSNFGVFGHVDSEGIFDPEGWP